MTIPLLPSKKDSPEMELAAKHGAALRKLIKQQHMSFDETLRAFTGVLFWSKPARRRRLVKWLEEFLTDLVRTAEGNYKGDAQDVWGEDPS